jgi:hypothetical protein
MFGRRKANTGKSLLQPAVCMVRDAGAVSCSSSSHEAGGRELQQGARLDRHLWRAVGAKVRWRNYRDRFLDRR